jgi:hypothetical protein
MDGIIPSIPVADKFGQALSDAHAKASPPLWTPLGFPNELGYNDSNNNLTKAAAPCTTNSMDSAETLS